MAIAHETSCAPLSPAPPQPSPRPLRAAGTCDFGTDANDCNTLAADYPLRPTEYCARREEDRQAVAAAATAIIAGVAGGLVLFVIILVVSIVLCVCCCCKKKATSPA